MKILPRLTALLILCASHQVAFATPPMTKAGASSAATVKPQWDHQRHIRFCAQRGEKNCPTVTIPPGIKHIRGIVSTSLIPGVPHGFVIFNRKDTSMNVYLCATGIDSASKLRCGMPCSAKC